MPSNIPEAREIIKEVLTTERIEAIRQDEMLTFPELDALCDAAIAYLPVAAGPHVIVPNSKTRLCVVCGKEASSTNYKPGDIHRDCETEEMPCCTFDMTPEEAWQYWKVKYHELRDRKPTPPDDEVGRVKKLEAIALEAQEWCDAVDRGTSWDDWDHHYKRMKYTLLPAIAAMRRM